MTRGARASRASGAGGGWKGGVGGAGSGTERIAVLRFMRPPVETSSPGTGSTVARSAALSWPGVREEFRASRSAAAPAVIGEENDVPLPKT